MRSNPNPEETTKFIELLGEDKALTPSEEEAQEALDYYTHGNHIDYTIDYFHAVKSKDETYGIE